MMTTPQIIAKYGEPGPDNLTTIQLPYRMRIAWDITKTVDRMQCHKFVAVNLTSVFTALITHYGYEEIKRLGIDLFGGCYNFRQMRGGKDWSRHSWGIAVDLDPARNGLKTPWVKAQFSKPGYAPMIDLFYRHGFFNLGKEKNYDAMHFEISS